MLIEFSVTNFLSLRERATLSLVKAKGQELEENNSFTPTAPATPALLHTAAIYGPNAAGKSNIIKALRLMERLVLRSANGSQAGEKLAITPFLLDATSSQQPTEFEVHFVSQGVRYQYGFAATQERIVEEWLLAYPRGRPQQWIERDDSKGTPSDSWGKMDKLTGQKHLWQSATRPNALFLSTAIQLNNEQLKPVFDWFKDTLQVIDADELSPGYSIRLCGNAEGKKNIVEFLKVADLGIGDIEVKEEKFNVGKIPQDIPDELRKKIENDLSTVSVETVHTLSNGSKVHFDMEQNESEGTHKFFTLSGPWLDTLDNGNVLVVDELNNSLHPLMVEFLVKRFNTAANNPKNAQLVFTTHDTTLLNQALFRRDQIWFCEKDRHQSTKLYPLTDFSPRKGLENIERGYLSGRYGALPNLKNKNIKTPLDV